MEKCRITTPKNCEPCYQGKFWDNTTKTFKTWKELQQDKE